MTDSVPRLRVVGDGPADRTSLAKHLLDRGMEKEALAELTAALRENPELAEAHQLMGRLFVHRHEFQKALAHLDWAVSLNPELQEAWLMKAMAHHRLEDFDNALEAVERALENDEDMERAYMLEAEILRDMQRPEEAVRALERVVELAPDDLACHLRLAELYTEQGRDEEARREMTLTRKLNWYSGSIDKDVGDLYESQGSEASALECYRRAVQAGPLDAPSLIKAGTAFHRRRLGGAALSALSSAARRDPKAVSSYVEMSRIYRDEGRSPEAVAMLRAALAIEPQHTEAQELLRQLEQSDRKPSPSRAVGG